MATFTEPTTRQEKDSLPGHRPGRRSQRGRSAARWFVGLAVIAALVGGGIVFLPTISMSTTSQNDGGLTHRVVPEQLLVTVAEDGNVESASNVDVKCEVAGGGTILWIIEDGSTVKKGDELIRLDTSLIEDQLNTQRIAYEKALATKIKAEEDYAAAEISVREYRDGMYKQELQTLESAITVALENLRSAQNMLEHTERMARKGFATALQLEADQFSVQRAQLDLDAAKTAKHVLVEYTYAKTLKSLEALRDAAKALVRSEEAASSLEESKLKRLEAQLKNCVITAPQGGMVIYANDSGRRSNEVTIEEGAVVREGQNIIRLPDLSRMQVKVTVHESKVDRLQPGMAALITIQGRRLPGHVVSVASQPEPTSWFSSNIKEYATTVAIEGESNGIRPGMTAAVEILVADLKDVLAVPVSCVVEQRGKFYAWVKTPGGPERRPLVLGMTNDKKIEIKDGLKEGDLVLLNPRAVVPEARDEGAADEGEESGPGFPDRREGPKGGLEGRSPGGGPPGAGPSPGGGAAPQAGPGGARSGGGTFSIAQFDTDKDGKVSKAEAPERMQQFFDRVDTNSDGFLDAGEAAEMRRRAAARGPGGPGNAPGGPPGAGGPPGPGGSRPVGAGAGGESE